MKAFSIIAPQWPDADELPWIKRIVERRGLVWQAINAADVLPFGESPERFCGAPDSAVDHQRVNVALAGLSERTSKSPNGGDTSWGAERACAFDLVDPLSAGDLVGAIGPVRQHRTRELRPRRPGLADWLTHGLLLPRSSCPRNSVRPPPYHRHPSWLLCGTDGRFAAPVRASRSPPAPHWKTPGHQAILDDLWQCAEDQNASDGLYACRYPLFHRPLFEFLWAIPWSQKHLPLCDRYLQRRALKGLIDDDIRTRIGFGTGTRSFVEGLRRSKPWQDYLCDLPRLAALGLVDADGWRHAIQEACAGKTGAEALLLRAMTVEVWPEAAL